MKKMILMTVSILALAASLAWGGCDDQGCSNHNPQLPEEQSTTGTAPQTEQVKPKGKARNMNLDDFSTPSRAAEKDCESANCHEPGKPQLEPRSQEKKGQEDGCGSNCN